MLLVRMARLPRISSLAEGLTVTLATALACGARAGVGGGGGAGDDASIAAGGDRAQSSNGTGGSGEASSATRMSGDTPSSRCSAEWLGCIGQAWEPDADDPCSMAVPMPTSSTPIDYNAVNLAVCDGDFRVSTFWVSGPEECREGGWYYSGAGSPGSQLTLCEATCRTLDQPDVWAFLTLGCGGPKVVG